MQTRPSDTTTDFFSVSGDTLVSYCDPSAFSIGILSKKAQPIDNTEPEPRIQMFTLLAYSVGVLDCPP